MASTGTRLLETDLRSKAGRGRDFFLTPSQTVHTVIANIQKNLKKYTNSDTYRDTYSFVKYILISVGIHLKIMGIIAYMSKAFELLIMKLIFFFGVRDRRFAFKMMPAKP